MSIFHNYYLVVCFDQYLCLDGLFCLKKSTQSINTSIKIFLKKESVLINSASNNNDDTKSAASRKLEF